MYKTPTHIHDVAILVAREIAVGNPNIDMLSPPVRDSKNFSPLSVRVSHMPIRIVVVWHDATQDAFAHAKATLGDTWTKWEADEVAEKGGYTLEGTVDVAFSVVIPAELKQKPFFDVCRWVRKEWDIRRHASPTDFGDAYSINVTPKDFCRWLEFWGAPLGAREEAIYEALTSGVLCF